LIGQRPVLVAVLTVAALGAGAVLAVPSAPPPAAAATAPSPACTPASLNASASLAGVTVSPLPGGRDASAATQISFLGVPAGQLSGITVVGSKTGTHSGLLAAYSQGDGASFLPARPFAPGEVVSVHAGVLESGQTTPISWGFTVAVRDTAISSGGSSPPAPNPRDYQSFRSRPDLRPPTVTVTSHAAPTATGDLFLAPYSGPGQYGPMILDESGSLVWFKALPAGARAADFRVQSYEGKPVLTWWQDPLVANGSRAAGLVIADSSYRTVAVVRGGNGYQPDLHEFQITPQGTALITVYDGIDCNLSSLGGPRDGAVADTLVQEIDLRTGLVMFEWHSIDHVPLTDSYASPRPGSRIEPFDFFHINSIDSEQDGDLLVDARNTWAAYDVDSHTGEVRWRLGGKRSSFALGAGTATAWQHDARQQPNGNITFFDNGATPRTHPQSRAIEVSVDVARMTATLVHSYAHPRPLVAGSQGNMQALAGGDWMVGWGQSPYFSEFAASGQLVFDAHLPSSYESYRTYRLPWSGRPAEPPALSDARPTAPHRGAIVYASWNGATEVASWRVLAGRSRAGMTPVASAPRGGFETAIPMPAAVVGPYVEAQALDAAGNVIGVSPVAHV
jgi:hypothetical protein